jgi:hypothetical protein
MDMGTGYNNSQSEGLLPLDDPLKFCVQQGYSHKAQPIANGAQGS